jgi:hypothetical protein
MAERMVMRPRAPNPKNGFPAGRRNGLFALSVSICLRLEIIAILSGFVSPPENVTGDQL